MNYQEFVSSVTGFLRESLPGGTKLDLIPMEKNNGIIMDGLSIRKQGHRVAPTIYLEAYYREYLDGCSLRGIYEEILECCEDCELEESFDVSFFSDYEKVRQGVVYKLVNYEKNRELLQKVPHLPFLDLAIVFYCYLRETPVGNATVLIHNSHLKLWDCTMGELYRDARANAGRLLPARLEELSVMIKELSGGQETPGQADVPMYVLTNTVRSLGAVSILYEGVLKSCGERLGEAYYVLPSSIHEVILIPASAVEDTKELQSIVRDINETQVRETEVLSDNIYYYSPISGQLSLVES